MIRLAGAELIRCLRRPIRTRTTTCRYSGRLAERLAQSEPNGAIWANQFDNTANRQAHVEMTGPRDLGTDRGAASMGSSVPWGRAGTLAGARGHGAAAQGREDRACRSRGLGPLQALPPGKRPGATRSPRGIGRAGSPANLEGFTPDTCYKIPDTEALPIVFDTLAEEGLCLGGSSGINMAGAVRMAREMGAGAYHSSTILLRTTAPATSPSSTIPNSCAKRACLRPSG